MATKIDEILWKLKSLSRMADLNPTDFAEEGGYADTLAREFGRELKSTQLRKVFGALKQVDIQVKRDPLDKPLARSEINRLIPELAYAFGRNLVPKGFYDLMKMCLSQTKLQTVGDFRRLMEFLTALLAYHKFHS
jgi:CRISPR-associated protein Csm2